MAFLTSSWIFDWLILLISTYIVLYFYVTRNFSHWSKLGIKVYKKPLAFFGNFASVIFARKTPEQFLREIYNAGKGEQFMGYYILDTPHLMVRDPELIKHVLVKDSSNFYNKWLSGNKNDDMSCLNVFLAKDPPWKSIRQKLTPVFTTGKIKLMFELMLEIGQELDIYLESLNLEGEGRVIEMKEVCAALTTDLIGTTAYGMKFNSLNNPNADFRKHGKNFTRSTYKRYVDFLSMMFMPQLLSPFNVKFFDNGTTEFLRNVFWEAIEKRLKEGIKRTDLLDILIELRESQKTDPDKLSIKFDGDALVGQAAIFFAGGFETSSTTMSFALYELAKHPEMQQRLRKEINDALEKTDGKVTYDMIGALPYLHMVVNETLRLYPVLPFLDRVPERDYEFPGTKLKISKGQPVMLPMRALHVDPEYFPNPEVFDPERFSEENKHKITPYTYFPFGEGPRSCIGLRVGYLQTKLGLVHIISKYALEPSEKTLIPMVFDNLFPFSRPRGGLPLRIRKISSK